VRERKYEAAGHSGAGAAPFPVEFPCGGFFFAMLGFVFPESIPHPGIQ
jgi:hypothetical protein